VLCARKKGYQARVIDACTFTWVNILAYENVFRLLTTHDGWASVVGTSATSNIIFEGVIATRTIFSRSDEFKKNTLVRKEGP
jgi:hypothetical protein